MQPSSPSSFPLIYNAAYRSRESASVLSDLVYMTEFIGHQAKLTWYEHDELQREQIIVPAQAKYQLVIAVIGNAVPVRKGGNCYLQETPVPTFLRITARCIREMLSKLEIVRYLFKSAVMDLVVIHFGLRL